MLNKYTVLLVTLVIVGCQSKLDQIGQEHAKEVVKWQELARYAGNELKYLGLTITAGVQITQSPEEITYSIINVQLNHDADHTEVDLLSPEFAEKFACGVECEKLGLYDSNFAKQQTQLTSFFSKEEGNFFEFYGRLTRLNVILANYRASSPEILKKYLNLMLNRKLVFNSLSEFFDHLDRHVTEDKLLAFSRSGFISPVEDRLSSTFKDDLISNLPPNWGINDMQVNVSRTPDDNWDLNAIMPDDNWDSNTFTPDDLFYNRLLDKMPTATVIRLNWEQAKQSTIQIGSIACSFSDNSFGVVKQLETNQATLEVIAQARVEIDGMKLYPQPGYLFTAPDSFYFVKAKPKETYPLSDIAPCNIEHLKRGQDMKKT